MTAFTFFVITQNIYQLFAYQLITYLGALTNE